MSKALNYVENESDVTPYTITENVCDTVETKECYTKWVKHYITLRVVRLRLSVTLLRRKSATQSE